MRKRNTACFALAAVLLWFAPARPAPADDLPGKAKTLEPVPMLSTTELKFGHVALRSVKSESFDIANQGADTLIITSITSESGYFDVSPDSVIRLAQDSLLTVQVRFSPDESMQVNDRLLIASNAGDLSITLQAEAFELWPLAWRIPADSAAWFGQEDGLCSMTYNPVTHHVLALNKNDNAKIYILDPDRGRLLGTLNTPGADQYRAIAAAADGQLFLAALASEGSAFKLYRYADEQSLPELVFTGMLSGRSGDALAVAETESGKVLYVSGIDNPKLFTLRSQDGQLYRRAGDLVLVEPGAAGSSIAPAPGGAYLFIKGPGKPTRYIRSSGELVHTFDPALPTGTTVHCFQVPDESGGARTFLAAGHGFTPVSRVLELLGASGEGLCDSLYVLPAPTPMYSSQTNANGTAQLVYIPVSHLLLEMTTNNGLAAYQMTQVMPRPQMAGGLLIGRVKDAATQKPLMNAEVTILSTEFITTTDDSGTFAFTDLPAGLVTVQVSAYNYFSLTKTVFVAPGSLVTAEFLLQERRYLPMSVSSYPQGQAAVVAWDIQRPQENVSYHNKKPSSGWFQKFGRAYGAVFDLSSYPHATLEQIDFNHYAWQVLHGPYRYRVHIYDWLNSIELAAFDGTTTHDSYDTPKWEMAVDLGGLPWVQQAGIFIEPLSGSEEDAHPALSTDDTIPVEFGTNFIIEDINDPFLSAVDCRSKNAGMGNFLLDLWINPVSERVAAGRPLLKLRPLAAGALSPAIPGETRGLIPTAHRVESTAPAQPMALAGFAIYRVQALNPLQRDKLAVVSDSARTYVDESAPADSSYAYAVSAVYDSTETSLVLCRHQQPLYVPIAQARADADGNFVPDLLSRFISLRGVVSTPNLNPAFGSVHFLQDGAAGILLRANHNFQLEPGDDLFAFGELVTEKGLNVLEVTHGRGVQPLSKAAVPEEQVITAAAFAENLEGVLVRLNGFQVVQPTEWPAAGVDGLVRISNGPDTVLVRIDQDLDMDGMPVPGGFFNLSGIVGQHTESTPANRDYELWPRSLADFQITVSVETQTATPLRFDLGQNYPNPFNPTTSIALELPHSEHILLEVMDILGRRVAVIHEGVLAAGRYRFEFQARDLASGTYFYRVRAGAFSAIKKMVVLR